MPGAIFYRLLLLILLALPLAAGQLRADEITILANPQEPHKYTTANGPAGIDVDVVALLSQMLGFSYRIRFIQSDARIQEEARQGRAEMLLLFSDKPSRRAYLDYPAYSYVSITWHFFIRAGDRDRIRFNSLADLEGLRVGATNDVAYTPEFWAAGLDLDLAPHNAVQLGKLLAGRIDVVPLNTISTLHEAKRKGILEQLHYLRTPLKTKPYYNVFVKNSRHPDLPRIRAGYDQALRQLMKDGRILEIFRKHLGSWPGPSG